MELTFKKARLVINANTAAAGGDGDNAIDSDGYDDENEFGWWALPEPALLQIFSRLSVYDLLQASLCCRRWNAIANDDLLWRQKFQENFRASSSIPLKPGAASWRAEYQRLSTQIPFVQAQRLEPSSEHNHGHTHQVLHVSFAHNGEMFATCSKDGYVIVWNAQHPCTGEKRDSNRNFSSIIPPNLHPFRKVCAQHEAIQLEVHAVLPVQPERHPFTGVWCAFRIATKHFRRNSRILFRCYGIAFALQGRQSTVRYIWHLV